VAEDIEVYMCHSNAKISSQTDKGTYKIVLEDLSLESLATVESYTFLGKFGPNKAIVSTYKGTDSYLEDLPPEVQILRGMGKNSSKIHSSKHIC